MVAPCGQSYCTHSSELVLPHEPQCGLLAAFFNPSLTAGRLSQEEVKLAERLAANAIFLSRGLKSRRSASSLAIAWATSSSVASLLLNTAEAAAFAAATGSRP